MRRAVREVRTEFHVCEEPKRAAFRAILDEEEPRLTAIAALIASLRREVG